MTAWYWLDTGYAVFGLGVDAAGIVRRAPPIAAWARGKSARGVLTRYFRRGAWVAQLVEGGQGSVAQAREHAP